MVRPAGIEPAQPQPRDFRHTTAFAASRCCSCAGLCLDPSFRVRPPPSSLYTFPSNGLRSALPRFLARGFSEFDGIHTSAFASWCSISMSKSLVSTDFTMGAHASSILHSAQGKVYVMGTNKPNAIDRKEMIFFKYINMRLFINVVYGM